MRGYVLDKERLKNGVFFDKSYFDNLMEEIREIRASERRFAFLQFNERDILDNPGKVGKEVAKTFAESEFEKYRLVQDRLFESDFDKHIKLTLENQNAKIDSHELSPSEKF